MEEHELSKRIREIFSWVVPIVIGVVVALLLKAYVVTFVRVDGSSMYPNLQNNERLILLKNKPIRRLSVVVFDAHNVAPGAKIKTNFVKRVVAVPGDKLMYTKTGKLYVNGKYVSQDFIPSKQRTTGTLKNVNDKGFSLPSISNSWKSTDYKKVKTVPKNEYFVMGDNRAISYDSRYWGFVPKSKMEGVVYIPFWGNHQKEINDYQ